MTEHTKENTEKIAALNDMFRQSQLTGKVELSVGIRSLDPNTREGILYGVKNYNAFAPQGDSQKERDFGAFECGEHNIFWLIDCYDEDGYVMFDNPTDIDRSNRVLRVMLVEEYH